MTLPVSTTLRICTSCDGAIDPGCRYAHDPDGLIICQDCVPSDFDHGQYEDEYHQDRYDWQDHTWQEWDCYE